MSRRPEELGSYSHAAVKVLEGAYLTLRPSFEVPGAIYAYRTDLTWDGSKLVFAKAKGWTPLTPRAAWVSVPIPSGHLYLSTNASGQMRLAMLGRQLRTGEMYGHAHHPSVRLGRASAAGGGAPGSDSVEGRRPVRPILPGEPRHTDYQRHLARVMDSGFARFVV